MKIIKIPNGIRCVVENKSCAKSVTVGIMFRVGSRDEPPDYYGLTHFAEHMFFKGTKNRPKASQISIEIDQYGGILNATTDYDNTYYYITIASQYLEVALDVLSDLLFNALFRQKDIDKEKEVVVNELKMYESNPERKVDMMFRSMVFEGTTLEHDVGGSIEKIRSATRDQFLAYISKYYQPSNCVVSIVGNVMMRKDKLEKMLNRYFDQKFDYRRQIKINKYQNMRFSKRNNYDLKKYRDVQNNFRFQQKIFGEMKNCFGILGFPAFKFLSKEYFIMLVIGAILGEGMSSRLFLNIREKHGLVYKIKTDINSFQDLSSFSINYGCHDKDLIKVYQLIWEELERLKKNKVGQKELKKAKTYLRGMEMLHRENNNYLSSILAYELINYDRVHSSEYYFEQMNKVTSSDIQRIAKQLFLYEKANFSVVSSEKVNFKF